MNNDKLLASHAKRGGMLGGKSERLGMQLAFPNARIKLKVHLELQLVDHSRWIYGMCLIGDHTRGSSQPPTSPAGAPAPAHSWGHPSSLDGTNSHIAPANRGCMGTCLRARLYGSFSHQPWMSGSSYARKEGGGGDAPAGLAGGRLDPAMWPCFEFNEENLNDHKL